MGTENKKVKRCKQCLNSTDGIFCDYHYTECACIKVGKCENFWQRQKQYNNGYKILDGEDFDNDGHQK